jgi:2-polyprenyl-6-methoxyphenol hydroxylase-like FAD-dependent oxidoreductase
VNASRPITIVGGGLAGLTLGIGLRQRNVPVTVWEAGQYPRHRVCGEFINGRGVDSLKRLGLLNVLEQAGVVTARTTVFYNGRFSSGLKQLPSSALCISRWALDAALAREFRRLGGELREAERWKGNAADPFVVHANGRQRQPAESGWRWFGMKAHAKGVLLRADLEMFLSRDSYVGISRLPGGAINLCGLFRRRTGDPLASPTAREWFTRIPHLQLQERLAFAEFDESSFCSVGGLSLRPKRAAKSSQCRVGDAITMIPPLTGNGMSMAFESAEIAIAPLVAGSRRDLSWQEAQQQIAGECDRRFAGRLQWARWLQGLAFWPMGQSFTLWSIAHSNWLWRAWFSLTR